MDVARQAEMLANRVRKTFRRLGPRFERRRIGAFRLFDRDIPEIRAVVDWYEGHLVIAEYVRRQTDELPGWLPTMARAAAAALDVPPERVHLRRRRTRPASGPRYERLGARGRRLEVREGDLRFVIDLDAHLDTGLFADHRETRARLRAESRERRFLNLFGYTGTFTCAAAAGGAAATTTVDRSATYLRRARENLERNRLWSPRHELVRADVEPFLERARRAGRTWDLCLLDPPSFSTGRGAPPFDALRDHRALIERTLAVLAPSGVLYFSTNHQRFVPRLAGLPAEVLEITDETIPEDYRNRTVHRCWRLVSVPSRR
ncbi:MAG: class I SAM-dependent methyltransferase [Deltaproteobacteria bacterium]|nr:class I SAM-dependent methyltransferase [Deltaproteobacteria bacterium]